MDDRLIEILEDVITRVDFSVLTGARGRADQTEAKATGRSKVGWPNSKHNCPIPEDGVPREEWREDPNPISSAVDIAPWQNGIDWNDLKQFTFLAGQVIATGAAKGYKIRWGGDWNMNGQGNWRDSSSGNFNDLPHFEIVET